MPRPWQLLDSVETDEGPLELRQRGSDDFMISVGGRVLMTSMLTESELAIAELGCETIRGRKRPRVLIGGLGLGFTLRAALDSLPRSAEIVVAELTPAVAEWCRGPLAPITDRSVYDPRVEVIVSDVADVIASSAAGARPRFDAIVLDLYVGPGQSRREAAHPLYGAESLLTAHRALAAGGRYAVWGEGRDPAFVERMRRAGFRSHSTRRGGAGALKHTLYLGDKA